MLGQARLADLIDRGERAERPTLFALSQLNGFVDPVVFVAGIRRLPRSIACAALGGPDLPDSGRG